MNNKTNIHQALTFACMTVLVAMFWVQARVVLHPVPSVAIETPSVAYGYSSTLASLCSNLEAYWRFDDESGTSVNDISENVHNATVKNVTSGSEWTISVASAITFLNSGALVLGGTNQHVVTGADSGLKITGDVSISAWVKYSSLTSGADANVIVANGGASESSGDNLLYYFNIQSDGTLQLRWENGSGVETRVTSSTASAIQSGVWNHMVVTRDVSEDTVKFYDSGSLLGSAQTYTNDPDGGGSNKTYIGIDPEDTLITGFNGNIDDLRIYTSVLTGSQISLLSSTGDVYGGCTCGNGVIESPETCDNGSSNSDSTVDACRTSCRVAYCGDGITDAGETCDDGNSVNTDSCTNTCTSVSCGDGIINGSEVCDDGDDNSDTIVDACRTTCVAASCGDGVTDTGESCDGSGETSTCTSTCTTSSCGDSITNTTAGETCDDGGSNSDSVVDACRTTCLVAGCGDSIVDAGEACDDGNSVNTDSCTDSCTAATCGDSFVQSGRGEECEPPGTGQCAANCKITTGGGRSNARKRNKSDGTKGDTTIYSKKAAAPVGCGNRLLEKNLNEECDEGTLNGNGSCSDECKILYCSDGIVSNSVFEECEPDIIEVIDGINTFASEPCGSDTFCEAPVYDPIGKIYRDGCITVFMSACPDDHNSAPEETAEEDAVPKEPGIPPVCGNGKIDEGEQCDMGGICEGGVADGVQWIVENMVQACIQEGGMPVPLSGDGCSDLCQLELCGNGILEPNGIDGVQGTPDDEECDGSQGCDEFCKGSVCGNGLVEFGEQCDDGDTTDNDGCSSRCTYEICGDGIQSLVEQCDDGNTNDGDGCSQQCKLEGNEEQLPETVVQEIVDPLALAQSEAPLPINAIDVMTPELSAAQICGNGIREPGEQCDGGPQCTNTCQLFVKRELSLKLNQVQLCGNRMLDPGEECDDGNTINGDRCSSTCTAEIVQKQAAPTDVLGTAEMFKEQEPVQKYIAYKPRVMPKAVKAKQVVQPKQVIQPKSTVQAMVTYPQYNIPQYQQVYYQPQYVRLPQYATPVGDTGPAAILIIAAGASAGIGFTRRRRK